MAGLDQALCEHLDQADYSIKCIEIKCTLCECAMVARRPVSVEASAAGGEGQTPALGRPAIGLH